MDDLLMAALRLMKVTNDFATCADRGESMKAMHYLSDTFRIGAAGEEKPKGAFANLLMMRQVMDHQSRHHVAFPTMTKIQKDKIAGVVPVVSYKIEGEKNVIDCNEFHVEIILVDDGEWKIDHLRMIPFSTISSLREAK